ncbi:NIPSNAP family protein [Profundibacter sp.]
MITCTLKYVIDPYQIAEFEAYAKAWIHLIKRMGGIHHGYWLPDEGANNIAHAAFSFPSLSAYEAYRNDMANDAECQAVFRFAEQNRCILSYERSFTRPVLEGASPQELGMIK